MEKFKNFLFFLTIFALLAISFLFFLNPQTLAVDLEVTFESEPLFSQAVDGYWYPGRSETRRVTVKNKSGDNKTVIVEAFNEISTYSEDLADVLELIISTAGTDLYGGSLGTKYLADFYNESELTLATLLAGQSITYDFTVTMSEPLGNIWQNKDTGFDLKIGFYGVAVGGAAAAPVCAATTPTSAPVLSLTGTEVGTVSLSWTSVLPATHYLIAYGLASGGYIYGNPNIGNVTKFTVSGLSGGTTYYFVVKGINDCAPGPYSNEISATPTGLVIIGFPPGFLPILGVATPSAEPEGELGEALATEEGEVAGVGIRPWNWWIWIPAGVAAVGSLAFLYLRFFPKR